jgi:hypothetical protein
MDDWSLATRPYPASGAATPDPRARSERLGRLPGARRGDPTPGRKADDGSVGARRCRDRAYTRREVAPVESGRPVGDRRRPAVRRARGSAGRGGAEATQPS